MAEPDRKKEYLLAVIFSIIGGPLVTYLSCRSCIQDLEKFFITASVSTMMWIVMWIGNSELTHFINKRISWVQFPFKRFVVGIISTVGYTVFVAMILLKLWEWSRDIKFTSYYIFILISLIITFLITLFLHGREFLLQWKQSAVEAERYQKESLSAKYESLKNQINPHFLFNSLNVLSNLVYTDQEKAALFIKKMADVYRYVLDTQGRELVDVEEELKFAESYIYLQQIRFGNNLKVNIQVDHNHGKVLPLAIQMLIENAIKHNEVSSQLPLEININSTQSYIEVVNTIQAKYLPREDSPGLGLENIRKRYEFLTSQPVEVKDQDGKFLVRIPVLSLN
jgi:LytS/YehU family sensor histidine kinase